MQSQRSWLSILAAVRLANNSSRPPGGSLILKTLLVLAAVLTLGLSIPEQADAAAPVEAINFADAMLNKLTLGTLETTGPYPEEGFRTGGRADLEDYFRDVIDALTGSAAEYCAVMDAFAPQFYFNDTVPNRAKDNWVRDFGRLEGKALCGE